ncbi:MAG TPA: hypothetical protein VFD90_04015 [Gaiellales bacterium]|jgi:hypothetical protein|nr:hypothetical protein [Gaiellales bacterium]
MTREADPRRGVVFSAISVTQGIPPWNRADVVAPARHRLYRATVAELFVLSATDERVPVALA